MVYESDNPASLPEKRYEINGRTFVLRPMTFDRLIDYLIIVEEERERMKPEAEGSAFDQMRAMARRVPDILSIALSSDGMDKAEMRAAVAGFPVTLLREITADFFVLNPSWSMREATLIAQEILGLVTGNPQTPPTGEAQSNG
jgi:hypothetical protein